MLRKKTMITIFHLIRLDVKPLFNQQTNVKEVVYALRLLVCCFFVFLCYRYV